MLSLNIFPFIMTGLLVLQSFLDVGEVYAIPYENLNAPRDQNLVERQSNKAPFPIGPIFPTGFPTPTGLPFPGPPSSLPSSPSSPSDSTSSPPSSNSPSLPTGFPSLPSGFPSLPSSFPGLPLPSEIPGLPSGLIPKLPVPGGGFPSPGSGRVSTVVASINAATGISGDLSKLIQDLSSESFPKVIQFIIEDFKKLAISFGNAVSQIANSDPVGDLDAGGVVAALTGFVKVSQNFSEALIGQRGFFARYAILTPLRMGLLTLKNLADKFALMLINFIPTKSPFIKSVNDSFKNTLQKTIQDLNPEKYERMRTTIQEF